MENLRTYNNETPIKNCLKLQMFAYFPDGSIQVEEYLCSCCSCLNGDFISSSIEKGTLLPPELEMLIIYLIQILKKIFYIMISYLIC